MMKGAKSTLQAELGQVMEVSDPCCSVAMLFEGLDRCRMLPKHALTPLIVILRSLSGRTTKKHPAMPKTLTQIRKHRSPYDPSAVCRTSRKPHVLSSSHPTRAGHTKCRALPEDEHATRTGTQAASSGPHLAFSCPQAQDVEPVAQEDPRHAAEPWSA